MAKRGVARRRFVEGLDVIEDRVSGVSHGGEATTMNEFIFQATFNDSIAALSQQLPRRLFEGMGPWSASAER